MPLFYGTTNVVVYYLSGTKGWGATYGGRPTELWQAQMLPTDLTFGVQTNQFGFNIAWTSGMNIVVETCTNLASPVWFPLQTNTLTTDSLYVTDPDWTNFPCRYYRIRWP